MQTCSISLTRLCKLISCVSLLQTIESTREKDETMVSLDDAEVEAAEAQDEFAGIAHLLQEPAIATAFLAR